MGQNHCKGTKREKRTLQNILLTRVHYVSYVLFRQFLSSFFGVFHFSFRLRSFSLSYVLEKFFLFSISFAYFGVVFVFALSFSL